VSGVPGEAGAPGGLPFKVGIDLLEIERLERALERTPRLAERLFTPAEREYAASRGRPGQHLAARFCAKESVAKALGLPAWNFRDVEVVNTDGPPEVRLHGAAATQASALGVRVSVSITHSRRDAAAVAIASRQ
jgi:holo-[acyl-carrier protein] synthase